MTILHSEDLLHDYSTAIFMTWCRKTGHDELLDDTAVQQACAQALEQAGISESIAMAGIESLPFYVDRISSICEQASALAMATGSIQ